MMQAFGGCHVRPTQGCTKGERQAAYVASIGASDRTQRGILGPPGGTYGGPYRVRTGARGRTGVWSGAERVSEVPPAAAAGAEGEEVQAGMQAGQGVDPHHGHGGHGGLCVALLFSGGGDWGGARRRGKPGSATTNPLQPHAALEEWLRSLISL